MCVPCLKQWYLLSSLIFALLSFVCILGAMVLLLEEPWEPMESATEVTPCVLRPKGRRMIEYGCHLEDGDVCGSSVGCDTRAATCVCRSKTGSSRFSFGTPCRLLNYNLGLPEGTPSILTTSDDRMVQACTSDRAMTVCLSAPHDASGKGLNQHVVCDVSVDDGGALSQLKVGFVFLCILEPISVLLWCFFSGTVDFGKYCPSFALEAFSDSDEEYGIRSAGKMHADIRTLLDVPQESPPCSAEFVGRCDSTLPPVESQGFADLFIKRTAVGSHVSTAEPAVRTELRPEQTQGSAIQIVTGTALGDGVCAGDLDSSSTLHPVEPQTLGKLGVQRTASGSIVIPADPAASTAKRQPPSASTR